MRTVMSLVAWLAAAGVITPGWSQEANPPPVAARSVVVPVAGQRGIVFDVPGRWTHDMTSTGDGVSATLRLRPAEGDTFSALVTVTPAPDGAGRIDSFDALRGAAEAMRAAALPRAVEEELPLEEISGSTLRCLCFAGTDRQFVGKAPPPGEWQTVTAVACGAGSLLVSATILTNGKDVPERSETLRIIAAGRPASPDEARAAQPTLPDTPLPRWETRQFRFLTGEVFEMDVRADWGADVMGTDEVVTGIGLTAANADAAIMVVSEAIAPRPVAEIARKMALDRGRQLMKEFGRGVDLKLEELRHSEAVVGWHSCHRLGPGSPSAHVTAGAAARPGAVVAYEIRTLDCLDPTRAAMLEAIARSRLLPAQVSVATMEPVRHNFPGKSWSLLLTLPGFELEPVEVDEDRGHVVLRGSHPATSVVISAWLERAAGPGGAAHFRAQHVAAHTRGPYRRTGVKQWERGEMALLEGLVVKHDGLRLQQKNVNAFLARDGIWIDVHLSKLGYEPSEWGPFADILDGIRLDP
jgi:hypothetical protein